MTFYGKMLSFFVGTLYKKLSFLWEKWFTNIQMVGGQAYRFLVPFVVVAL